MSEAVQQPKIGRKRKANRASNPKRRKIFSAKSNCVTSSSSQKSKEVVSQFEISAEKEVKK